MSEEGLLLWDCGYCGADNLVLIQDALETGENYVNSCCVGCDRDVKIYIKVTIKYEDK